MIAAGQLLARPRRERGERERGERVAVDVGFCGEEDVVAAGVVPLVWRAAHGADTSGHNAVGLLGVGERGPRVGADEHGDRAGAERPVAGVGERPAGEEGVVGEELLLVVGGPAGEVEFDEQVEGELEARDPQLE